MSLTCPDGCIVHTPPANIREGLLGYVLRVSEANGYDTPWHIFSLAGIRQGGMAVSTLSIEKLAKVIGRPVRELARLPWQQYPNGDPVPPLNEGRSQLLRHLLLKHPKICPHCVAENGMIDAAWDLRIMLACPKHAVSMVDRCPVCQHKLTWFRRGLDHCRCGHHLTKSERSSFPQHTIDLLQVIYDTLHGLPTNPAPPSGIPANDLHRLGIDDLLKLLTKVGNAIMGREPRGKYAAYDPDRLVRLSGVFEDWPKQFHRFLRSIDLNPDQATMGLARRFGCFYSELVAAKRIDKEKMVFFRTAFGEYAHLYGVAPGADPRFFLTPAKWRVMREQGLSPSQIRLQTGGASKPTNMVNQTELALRLGVRPTTAKRWAAQGLFGLERHGTLASGRPVYKTPISLPSKLTTGTMDVRRAAKYLGIPVSMLVRLRRDGYYRIGHLGVYLMQFNEPDLDRLRNDILDLAPKILPELPVGHITMAAIFRMKLYGVENKYQIVRSILDGNLVPTGRRGDNIGDMVIAGDTIEAFREEMSRHGTIPSSKAAKVLECDSSVCASLVIQGKLQGTYRGRNLYVTTESIETFRAQYISCIGIAKRLGYGFRRVRQVRRVLSEQGSDLLRVQQPRQSKSAEQIFCAREQAERLFLRNP